VALLRVYVYVEHAAVEVDSPTSRKGGGRSACSSQCMTFEFPKMGIDRLADYFRDSFPLPRSPLSHSVNGCKEDTIMADFIFRVDSVHLSDTQQEKIATAIRGAVLTELARLDLHSEESKQKAGTAGLTPGGGSFLYIPINWRGGKMINLAAVEAAAATVLTVSERAEQTRAA
jgi:hypothetical protein